MTTNKLQKTNSGQDFASHVSANGVKGRVESKIRKIMVSYLD